MHIYYIYIYIYIYPNHFAAYLKLIQYCKSAILPWWLSGKESPANTGDMDLIPGLGRSHMLQEQLSLCATTIEPAL